MYVHSCFTCTSALSICSGTALPLLLMLPFLGHPRIQVATSVALFFKHCSLINNDDTLHNCPCPAAFHCLITALPCSALPCPALPYSALLCSALPCPALPCPALPCPALSYSALPCAALLCPALLCSALLHPPHALPSLIGYYHGWLCP